MEPEILKRSDVRELLWEDYQSIFLQPDGIQGLLQEARLYFRWGFDLRDFPENKRVIFWHARNDTMFPLPAIKRLIQKIQRAKAIYYPGGHISFLVNDIDNIVRRLKSEWQPSVKEKVIPVEEVMYDVPLPA